MSQLRGNHRIQTFVREIYKKTNYGTECIPSKLREKILRNVTIRGCFNPILHLTLKHTDAIVFNSRHVPTLMRFELITSANQSEEIRKVLDEVPSMLYSSTI